MPDPLQAIRLLVPAWVPWLALCIGLTCTVLATLLAARVGSWLALRLLLRRKAQRWPQQDWPQEDWPERARLAYPARIASSMALLVLPMVTTAFAFFFDSDIGYLHMPWQAVIFGTVGLALGIPNHLRVQRIVLDRPLSLGRWLQGLATLCFVFRPLLPAVGLLAIFAPPVIGLELAIWLLVTLVVLLGLGTGIAIKLAALVGFAKPAPRRLLAIVERAVPKGTTAPKAVFVVPWSLANAAAFPMLGCLAYTDEALEQLSDDQLVAVTSHELGHLAESPTILFVRLLSVLTLLPLAAAIPLWTAWGIAGAFGGLATFVVLSIFFRRFATHLEKRADAHAHEHEHEQGTYASALEKIHEINLIPMMMPGKQVHPHLYDRLEAVGEKPDYPRPKAPSRRTSLASWTVAIIVALAVMVSPSIALRIWLPSGQYAHLDLALGRHDALDNFAEEREAAGDIPAAISAYRAMMALFPTDPFLAVDFTSLLADHGRCAKALQMEQQARARIEAKWPLRLDPVGERNKALIRGKAVGANLGWIIERAGLEQKLDESRRLCGVPTSKQTNSNPPNH